MAPPPSRAELLGASMEGGKRKATRCDRGLNRGSGLQEAGPRWAPRPCQVTTFPLALIHLTIAGALAVCCIWITHARAHTLQPLSLVCDSTVRVRSCQYFQSPV